MNWSEAALESLCTSVKSGGTPSTKNDSYYGGEIPWLRTQEVNFNEITDTEIKITEEGLANSAAKWIPANSVIVAMYGNSAGRIAITKIPLTTNQACCNLIVNNETDDYRYVYYSLMMRFEHLKGLSKGAAQNNLNAGQVREFKIPRPPKGIQVKIGDALSKYDSLIENNRRRIQLLEESARLLYREWFVHLRFPGHEHVKVVDGVPQGWKKLTVKECCKRISYGYTASAETDNVGPKFLRITDIVPQSVNWDNVPYCSLSDKDIKKYKLYEGDVVVARTGATVGYAKRIPKHEGDIVYASYLVRFSPNTEVIDDLLLGVFMESVEFKGYVKANAGGAAQPNANAQVLSGAKLLVPPKTLQGNFRDYACDLLEQKRVLESQSLALTKARDLLLPRLMNGDIAV
jgi:type I restriction enzyme S subunit